LDLKYCFFSASFAFQPLLQHLKLISSRVRMTFGYIINRSSRKIFNNCSTFCYCCYRHLDKPSGMPPPTLLDPLSWKSNANKQQLQTTGNCWNIFYFSGYIYIVLWKVSRARPKRKSTTL